MPVVRTDARTHGHVSTEISRMHRYKPNFLTHGAPLRTGESSAKNYHWKHCRKVWITQQMQKKKHGDGNFKTYLCFWKLGHSKSFLKLIYLQSVTLDIMLRRYICLTWSSDLSFARNFFGKVKFLCGLGRLDGSINKIKLAGRDTAPLSFKAQLNLLVHSLYYTLFRHCFIFIVLSVLQ